MNRWILVLMLWSAQAFAKPQMKTELVESKVLTPSFMCQTGPFEVDFTAIEAKHGQQLHINLETVATGASLKYQVTTRDGAPLQAYFALSSTPNTIDPCAPLSQPPTPQTNSMTVAPKPQRVGPITVIPGPVTVTVVTPPQEASLQRDQLIIALPESIKAGTKITLTIWAEKPIMAKSMQISLAQVVPADPIAYAAWEAKQAEKAEAKAERLSKREARRFARQEARTVKVAIKSQEREKKAAVVLVQAAASVELKTQKAAEAQVKISARMERRQARRERRELRLIPKREAKLAKHERRALKLSLKREKRAPIQAARLEKQHRQTQAHLKLQAEKRERRQARRERRELRLIPKREAKLAKHERRALKLSLKREKRASIRVAHIERKHRHHQARLNLRVEKRERRALRSNAQRIANEPKLVLRTKKQWAKYQAKDKKLVAKIGKLSADQQGKRDWLETRRYNLFVANLNQVEGVYHSLLTAELKAQFKLELYDEVLAMKSDRETTYNLYVETRNQEKAQLNAAAALETNSSVAVAEAPKLPPTPAPLAEVYGPAPTPDASWQAGYWRWSGSQYVWISGHWLLPVLPAVRVIIQNEQKPAPSNKKGYSATKPK
jgi:hypothetical protein